MKNSILNFIAWFCCVTGFESLARLYTRFANGVYTRILGRKLGTLGKGALICRPLYGTGLKYIHIGKNFNCEPRLRLDAIVEHNGVRYEPRIEIGDNVCIQYDCHIGCVGHMRIGNNVLFAGKVYVSDHFHGRTQDRIELDVAPADRVLYSKGDVVIEDNVWLGEGVCVMPGVTIGRGAIVGANSVVTKNIPAYSVVAGVPAKIIRVL